MNTMLRKLGMIAGIAAATLLGGCTWEGGGWLVSIFSGEKSRIALNGTTDGVTITGQGEVQDKAARTRAMLDENKIYLEYGEYAKFRHKILKAE